MWLFRNPCCCEEEGGGKVVHESIDLNAEVPEMTALERKMTEENQKKIEQMRRDQDFAKQQAQDDRSLHLIELKEEERMMEEDEERRQDEARKRGLPTTGFDPASQEQFCDWVAVIQKFSVDEPLGLTLSSSFDNDELVVQEITSSATAVVDWNHRNPAKKIINGDEIRSVNGVKGNVDTLVNALKGVDRYELELRRQLVVSVNLDKHGQLGLKLDPDDLSVVQVTPGMIEEYNRNAARPSMEIYPQDLIVQVNDCTGSIEDLLEEIARVNEFSKMKLVFKRQTLR